MIDQETSTGVVRQLSADAWQIDDATVRVRYPTSGVVVYKFSGKMRPELVPKIREVAAAVLQMSKKISLFFDTEEMSGYHPEFRNLMTAWHEELREETRMAGVLVRSRVIRMAISVASLVTRGKLESFSDRASFNDAIERAVRASSQTRESRAF